jgi:hypothetical protein
MVTVLHDFLVYSTMALKFPVMRYNSRIFITQWKKNQCGTFIENASIAPFEPFNKWIELAPMMHFFYISSPGFDHPTLTTVNKGPTN